MTQSDIDEMDRIEAFGRDQKPFRDAIILEPNDCTTRLVFADWLDEHDDPRAAGYRVLGMRRVFAMTDRGQTYTERCQWWVMMGRGAREVTRAWAEASGLVTRCPRWAPREITAILGYGYARGCTGADTCPFMLLDRLASGFSEERIL